MTSWKLLAGLGLLLISFAGLWTVREVRSATDQVTGCETKIKPTGTDIAIVAIGHQRDAEGTIIRLGDKLCVEVVNVVTDEELLSLQTRRDEALDEVATLSSLLRGARERRRAGVPVPLGRLPATEDQITRLRKDYEDALAQLAQTRNALRDASKDIDFSLFINGVRSPSVASARAVSGPQTVVFELSPVSDAKSEGAVSWRSLLGGLPSGGTREVTIGIGPIDAKRPVVVSPVKATLLVFQPTIAALAALGLFVLVLALFALGRTTSLLRDNKRYSLGRVQMAFWLFATVSGFVFIWVATGQFVNVVSASTFTLLGIAGATGFAARAVGGPDTNQLESKGFFEDVLSDSQGLQLHRIQIALWTLVLGAIYTWNAFTKLELTEFDSNLLILVGIASSVYAGLKTQEK